MNCIILGDKFHKRMKSKGCMGLFPYSNYTIVEHQYKTINKIFENVAINYVCGFEHKKMLSFLHNNFQDKINPIYNPYYMDYNQSYSLSLAMKNTDEDYIVFVGDTILDGPSLNRFKPNLGSQVFVGNKLINNHVGCIINNNIISNIAYDLNNCLQNIYFISKKDTKTLISLLNNPNNYNCFIFEIFNMLIELDCVIRPFFTKDRSKHYV